MKGHRMLLMLGLAGAGLGGLAGGASDPPRPTPAQVKDLADTADKLRPLHRKLGKPRPGDWLDRHHEPGQTFAEYLRCNPVLPTARRRTIRVQPIGEFSDRQREVVSLAARFIERFYNLPVQTEKDLPLSVIPDKARRVHPTWGDRQILTGCILNDVLLPRLPKDAFACIAFTSSDLWPGEGWNFVFGQASLTERVGVWSIYRFGDPAGGEAAFRLCLTRTAKTGVHELGHMFSILHCTAYHCVMNGSNHLAESDSRPLDLCPECLAKVCWATGSRPVDRYVRLREFCRSQGLAEAVEFYDRSLNALGYVSPATAPASGPEVDLRPRR